jgi:large subunit ribosomal protein L15
VALGGGFEGGQMPLQRRLPKRGFKNPFRVEYHGVNVGQLATRFEAGAVVDLVALRSAGLVPRNAQRAKVLGNGELPHPLTIKVQAFSKAAQGKIEAAGGAAEVVAPVGRRAAE